MHIVDVPLCIREGVHQEYIGDHYRIADKPQSGDNRRKDKQVKDTKNGIEEYTQEKSNPDLDKRFLKMCQVIITFYLAWK